jgi:hypothetical protein
MSDQESQRPYVRMRLDVLRRTDVTLAAKALLAVLVHLQWAGGEMCVATNEEIALAAGCAVGIVRRLIDELIAAGIVERVGDKKRRAGLRVASAFNFPKSKQVENDISTHAKPNLRKSGQVTCSNLGKSTESHPYSCIKKASSFTGSGVAQGIGVHIGHDPSITKRAAEAQKTEGKNPGEAPNRGLTQPGAVEAIIGLAKSEGGLSPRGGVIPRGYLPTADMKITK